MKALIFFLALTISLPAFAKLHLEPYAAYSISYYTDREPSKQNITGTAIETAVDTIKTRQLDVFYSTGLTGGARIGYRSLGLGVGLDVSIGQWFSKEHILVPITWGPFVSYNLPLLFRVYGALLPQASTRTYSRIDDSTSAPFICNASKGIKVGGSYISLPFVSVNFEYQGLVRTQTDSVCKRWTHTLSASLNLIF